MARAAIVYHGTTAETLPGIRRAGLKKGSWCTPDIGVARHSAISRAGWNGQDPVVLLVRAKCRPDRKDRSGRVECQTVSTGDLIGVVI